MEAAHLFLYLVEVGMAFSIEISSSLTVLARRTLSRPWQATNASTNYPLQKRSDTVLLLDEHFKQIISTGYWNVT